MREETSKKGKKSSGANKSKNSSGDKKQKSRSSNVSASRNPKEERQKNGSSLLKFLSKKGQGAMSLIRSADSYGAPISLTYEGEDSYKTVPGGIISITFYFVFAFYCFIQGLEMYKSQNWTLTQQTVVAEPEDLKPEIKMAEYKDVTMGIQISSKREKQTDPRTVKDEELWPEYYGVVNYFDRDEYVGGLSKKDEVGELVKNATRYLQVRGMIEKKEGFNYKVFDEHINADLNTWKYYDTRLVRNSNNLQELQIDLDDVTLSGTLDSIEPMDVIIPRFQLMFNNKNFEIDMIQACRSNRFQDQRENDDDPTDLYCSEALKFNVPYVVNQVIRFYTDDETKKSQLVDKIEECERLLQTKDQDQIDLFMYDFYSVELMDRFNYLWTQQSRNLGVFIMNKFTEYDSNYNTTFGLTAMPGYGADLGTTVMYLAQTGLAIPGLLDGKTGEIQAWIDELFDPTGLLFQYNIFGRYALTLQNIIQEEYFEKLEFQHVIYDEVETFRKHDDPQFDYPYGKRKSSLDFLKPDITVITSGIDAVGDTNYFFFSDYGYQKNTILMQKSSVCLQGNFFDDIQSLPSTMYQFVAQWFSEKKDQDCGGEKFERIKYGSQLTSNKDLYDDYGKNVVKGKILFELVFKIDTFKTINQRDATKVFDFLGDVGGFAAAFQGILTIIGAFFSSQLLAGSIAQNLYIERKPSSLLKHESKKKASKSSHQTDQMKQVKNMFMNIRFSSYQVIFDPIISSLTVWFTKCCGFFKYSGFNKRSMLLNKCNDKFAKELDVLALLGKIRDSYGMLKFFKSKEHNELLKFNKDRTVVMSDSESEEPQSNSDKEDGQKDTYSEGEDQLGFEDHKKDMLQMRENFRQTIVKGLNVSKNIKKSLLDSRLTSTEIQSQYPVGLETSMVGIQQTQNLHLFTNQSGDKKNGMNLGFFPLDQQSSIQNQSLVSDPYGLEMQRFDKQTTIGKSKKKRGKSSQSKLEKHDSENANFDNK